MKMVNGANLEKRKEVLDHLSMQAKKCQDSDSELAASSLTICLVPSILLFE